MAVSEPGAVGATVSRGLLDLDDLADRRHAVVVDQEDHVPAGRRHVGVRRAVDAHAAGLVRASPSGMKRWSMSRLWVTEPIRTSDTDRIREASGVSTVNVLP